MCGNVTSKPVKRGGPEKIPGMEETESTAVAEDDEEMKEDPQRKSER